MTVLVVQGYIKKDGAHRDYKITKNNLIYLKRDFYSPMLKLSVTDGLSERHVHGEASLQNHGSPGVYIEAWGTHRD